MAIGSIAARILLAPFEEASSVALGRADASVRKESEHRSSSAILLPELLRCASLITFLGMNHLDSILSLYSDFTHVALKGNVKIVLRWPRAVPRASDGASHSQGTLRENMGRIECRKLA